MTERSEGAHVVWLHIILGLEYILNNTFGPVHVDTFNLNEYYWVYLLRIDTINIGHQIPLFIGHLTIILRPADIILWVHLNP